MVRSSASAPADPSPGLAFDAGTGPHADAIDAPPPSFETALGELEDIVEKMEDGSLSLEDSLAAYRRGASLVKVCEGALEQAREQVRVLDGDLLKPLTELPARGSERG